MNFAQAKAELGHHLFGTSLMIDLVGACTFHCVSCPVGQSGNTRKGIMSFDFFTAMLDRVQAQTRIKYVLLYSFSEPFLHPELPAFVRELKRRGVSRVMISTNLSRPKNVEAVLAAGLDELRISFSGWERGAYFHTGRDMEQFNAAMSSLSVIAPKYKARVAVIFHKYRTNLHELPIVRQWARRLGVDLIEETAFIIPFEKILADSWGAEERELIGHLILRPEDKLKETGRSEYCYYAQRQIVIDCHGKVFLCRHVYEDRFIVGDIMRDSVADIRKAQMDNAFCLKCKGAGLNNYTEPK